MSDYQFCSIQTKKTLDKAKENNIDIDKEEKNVELRFLGLSTSLTLVDSPRRYDCLPYPEFSDHSWLQLWQWHAYAHRTPQSSTDHDLLSEVDRRGKYSSQLSSLLLILFFLNVCIKQLIKGFLEKLVTDQYQYKKPKTLALTSY